MRNFLQISLKNRDLEEVHKILHGRQGVSPAGPGHCRFSGSVAIDVRPAVRNYMRMEPVLPQVSCQETGILLLYGTIYHVQETFHAGEKQASMVFSSD